MPDALFWTLTVDEVLAVLQRRSEREERKREQELYHAAFISSTMVNIHRKPGSSPVRPEDFIRRPRRAEDYMSVEQATAIMSAWAASTRGIPRSDS